MVASAYNEIYVPGKRVTFQVAGKSSGPAPRFYDTVSVTGTANLPRLVQARSYAELILWSSAARCDDVGNLSANGRARRKRKATDARVTVRANLGGRI
jgi:hypothetical protein